MPAQTARFQRPLAKLTIGSLDDPNLEVTAQYNPSQLELARSLTWKDVNPDNTPDSEREVSTGRDVEFTGGAGRNLSFEMLLDGVETNECVVETAEWLDTMSRARDASSNVEAKRRPHQCVIVWGDNGMKPMRCVIESITTKYIMFANDGRPLRANVSIKVREASVSKYDPKAFLEESKVRAQRQMKEERDAAEKRRHQSETERNQRRLR